MSSRKVSSNRAAAERSPTGNRPLPSGSAKRDMQGQRSPKNRAVPDVESLAGLRRAAQACDLYRDATQAVCGEGPDGASIVFIGEQPGDEEDRQGRPFVGPAGRVLDRALEAAGLERREAYITNAVKHFKFEGEANGAFIRNPTAPRSRPAARGSKPRSGSSVPRPLCALERPPRSPSSGLPGA
jgi:hypothetical protein